MRNSTQSSGIEAEQSSGVRARLKLSAAKRLAAVALLHLAIGCYYSGAIFFRHFTDGVPLSPVGHAAAVMRPGDQFEQLNRFTMTGLNLMRGRSPYYEGFQYNVSKDAPAFSEGWIFFPFSALGGLLAVSFGDAAAFNILVLLSYPLVGITTFVLVRCMTKNTAAALPASLILSTLPFRTAFLYGELVYAVEFCLFPLALWAFERFIERRNLARAATFGLVTFCCVTSNFQLAYFFFLFGAPYFAVGLWRMRRSEGDQPSRRWLWLPISLLPAGAYLLYLELLVGRSWRAIHPGSYDELWTYTPTLASLVVGFTGNDKTVFIGLPLLLFSAVIALWGLIDLLATGTGAQKRVWWTFGPMFVASYLFCFGPALDRGLHFPVYGLFFRYFPGGSATRTPGRIFAMTGLLFAVLFGLALDAAWRRVATKRGFSAWGPASVAAVCGMIVFQNSYVDPTMMVFEPGNAAYESIRGTKGRVLALPFQPEPDHYLNATFIYYAQKYDLKMFNGHSSLFTPAVQAATERLYSITAEGEMSESDWHWLKANEYQYIMAHDTAFEPKVSPIVLARLLSSPYLRLEGEANHVYKFLILKSPRATAGEGLAEFVRLLAANQDGPLIIYSSGWYPKETYPGQKPFRWMRGTRATLLVSNRIDRIGFSEKCPYNDLQVNVDGNPTALGPGRPGGDGWMELSIALPEVTKAYRSVELTTSRIFSVPTDQRQFGCMVAEIEASTGR